MYFLQRTVNEKIEKHFIKIPCAICPSEPLKKAGEYYECLNAIKRVVAANNSPITLYA
jgi:hypothetical protein